jgi:hypothetical protein
MADPRTSFTVLEDSSTQAGLPLHKVLEGDAVAAKNALPALVAKVSGTNVFQYLKLDPSTGALLTSSEGSSVCKKSPAGELAAGSATLVVVTGAEITLTASAVYEEIAFVVSSRRDSLFQIIQQDDATDTILAEIVVGSGAYTVTSELHCLTITAGATGVQKLKVKAKNFEALSSLRATITINEIQ